MTLEAVAVFSSYRSHNMHKAASYASYHSKKAHSAIGNRGRKPSTDAPADVCVLNVDKYAGTQMKLGAKYLTDNEEIGCEGGHRFRQRFAKWLKRHKMH